MGGLWDPASHTFCLLSSFTHLSAPVWLFSIYKCISLLQLLLPLMKRLYCLPGSLDLTLNHNYNCNHNHNCQLSPWSILCTIPWFGFMFNHPVYVKILFPWGQKHNLSGSHNSCLLRLRVWIILDSEIIILPIPKFRRHWETKIKFSSERIKKYTHRRYKSVEKNVMCYQIRTLGRKETLKQITTFPEF